MIIFGLGFLWKYVHPDFEARVDSFVKTLSVHGLMAEKKSFNSVLGIHQGPRFKSGTNLKKKNNLVRLSL